MPRKQYMIDLKEAQNDVKHTAVSRVRNGDDDGQFVFDVSCPSTSEVASLVEVTAMLSDVSDYPKDHSYVLMCGVDTPEQIAQTLSTLKGTACKSVFELIDMVAATLTRQDVDGDSQMVDSHIESEPEDDSDLDLYDSDDESFFANQSAHPQTFTPHQSGATQMPATGRRSDRAFRDRIRSDLRATKAAGFKVSQLGNVFDGDNAYVVVSIRIAKLGVSEEAMQAWQVEPSDYLMLVIQYSNGYLTNEQLQKMDNLRLKANLSMRVFASKYYKPTLPEAIGAFSKLQSAPSRSLDVAASASIRETFISRPLRELLNATLVPILRFRSEGLDWHGAERWYDESSVAGCQPDIIPDKYYEPEDIDRAFPTIVTEDHYSQSPRDILTYSFPLLAMQFTLRHFVRCTEFCMVCHRKMDSELEAIKPYVCERSLCLFQYMNMGFGPSIEHEIMAQPYVVDLLISFCYSSVTNRKLKDLPDGLALIVPFPKSHLWRQQSQNPADLTTTQKPATENETPSKGLGEYEVNYDVSRGELIFFSKPEGGCPVGRGEWILLSVNQGNLDGMPTDYHCRVAETTFFPTITISAPIAVKRSSSSTPIAPVSRASATSVKGGNPVTPAVTPRLTKATFTIYNQDFEQLDTNSKHAAIASMLDLLPSVIEMKEYLSKNHNALLQNWVSRIPPAAGTILRWIIASNRACIMQVDSDEGNTVLGKKQERLYGMKNYLQFRFAMGAPDKEQRFISAVRETKERLALTYPTIFAWHGSPLANWHSIIREGLHFKNVDHGRSFGHGVYHALDAGISVGYASVHATNWPNSILRVSSALALNEIVNAPKEFTSSNPYYVVHQLDWIQTRYLFVQCSPVAESGVKVGEDEVKPVEAHPQDPTRTPRGLSSAGGVVIPASAIKSGRPSSRLSKVKKNGPGFLTPSRPSKKQKGEFGGAIVVGGGEEDGNVSEETEDDDLTMLYDENDESEIEPASKSLVVRSSPASPSEPTTDFVSGSLDFATLPMMPMPKYATSATTKRLMNEINSLSKIQAATPPAELGWYIDTALIENTYQWIVELHSFHTLTKPNGGPLPLTDDLRKTRNTSVVLECRFPPSFPFSPPYVRVIRPRFLSFAQGGGGHIVQGGAMCMELLTNTGWNSVLPMDSVLLQVRMAIASEPFARLDMRAQGDYGAGEAAEGYLRACRTHGWKEPEDFKIVAHGMGAGAAGGGVVGF